MTQAHRPETWVVKKPAVECGDGLVATQHYAASDAAAQVLAQGGNAVDAAVTASFALGVVEPWMSGIGGGGYMLVYQASCDRVYAVDCAMVSPGALDPRDYKISRGADADLFGWPRVEQDLNVLGPASIAVPGLVAGLALALERFGTRTWAESLSPAIDLADAGVLVDWYTTLRIAAGAAELAKFPESRRIYLPQGFAPAGDWSGRLPRIELGRLAETLRRLAMAGAEDFYRGAIARDMEDDLRCAGSKLSLSDLDNYRARLVEPQTATYRGAAVHVAPGLTGGPTLLQALAALSETLVPDTLPDDAAYQVYAACLRDAYAHRLQRLGHTNDGPSPSSTSHISVVDADGNLVALTQTLLSPFGSKMMLPKTGLLMNNGVMWFDPRPGRSNSIAPGCRPLSNMCPMIVEQPDGTRVAAGAAGGRRIMAAMFQLVSFLVDYKMSLEQAFQQPRIDYDETGVVHADIRLAPSALESIAKESEVVAQPSGVYPTFFALPNGVSHSADNGRCTGAAFVMSPVAKVSAAGK